jgi:predicted nuclease of predicted toxin-antitoxin system
MLRCWSSGHRGHERQPRRPHNVAAGGMKFLLDENVELRIAAFLRQACHDVTAIAHDYPASLADRDILAIAVNEGRILITNDRDFGELIFREGLPHPGVIYFRLGLSSTAQDKIAYLLQVLMAYQDRLDRFLVVTPRGIRVR